MEPRRRVLLVDFGLALAAIVLGLVATPGLSVGVAVLFALGFAVMVAALLLVEHGDLYAVVDARRPGSLVVVAAATFSLGIALVLGRLAVPSPSGPLLAGMGAGLAGYRAVFGLLVALPETRLAQAGGGWRGSSGPPGRRP